VEDGDGDLKLYSLLQLTNVHQINLFTLAEHNTCWDLLPMASHLPQKMKGWWENS